jgi:predicted alpha/beta superfamily hydrolase
MREQLEAVAYPDAPVKTGGAPEFLDFIERELIPFVSANYACDNQIRMLGGYSFGGLFGLYALFHKPELFQKYFIGSPSIHYGEEITFTYEESYASQHEDLYAEVFMSAGGLEQQTSAHVLQMEKLLNSRTYPHLTVKTALFEGESHVSCYPAALSRGLIELLSD